MIKIIDYKSSVEGRVVYIAKSYISDMRCNDIESTTSIWNKDSQPTEYVVKETPEEILAMPDIEEGNKTIDWEQRRYEIAKEMLPVIYYDDKPQEGEDYLTLNQAANEAVRYAEALITELKKGTEQ